jgi:hypothetical protein
VLQARRELTAVDSSAHIGIAAQVLTFFKNIGTPSVPGATVSIIVTVPIVVAIPVVVIALSMPVIVIGTGFIIPLS